MSEGDRISEGAESASETASTSTPRPPSTTPSEATSTSYGRQPGRYKKRAHSETLSDMGFTSEEEDDLDMDDLEDNDSSGMSVDSDHVPAKRLRTSITTRSSKVAPVPNGTRDHQATPSATDTHESAPVPNGTCDHQATPSTTNIHESAPGCPDPEPTPPTPPSQLSSELTNMDTDEPNVGTGVPVTSECLSAPPTIQSQPETASGPKLQIPKSLSKNNIYDYISSVKETGFQNLLKVYITFELTDRSRIRGALPTSRRPKGVGWWLSRARPNKLPPYDSLKTFAESIVMWWIYIQPEWREIGIATVSRVRRDSFGDWERLYQPGNNGLLNVLILAYWWARILEERGSPVDGTYSWFVSDVSWVLTQLTAVSAGAHN